MGFFLHLLYSLPQMSFMFIKVSYYLRWDILSWDHARCTCIARILACRKTRKSDASKSASLLSGEESCLFSSLLSLSLSAEASSKIHLGREWATTPLYILRVECCSTQLDIIDLARPKAEELHRTPQGRQIFKVF